MVDPKGRCFGVPPPVLERLDCVTTLEELDALKADWNDLAQVDPTPFGCHAWYANWWRSFGGRWRLSIPVLWRGSQLAAAFPLCERHGRVRSMTNDHTPVFRPLARDGAALRAVVGAAMGRAGALSLSALPVGEPVVVEMIELVRGARRLCLLERGEVSPVVDTRGDFESYRRRMRSKWGSIERKQRKMQREHRAVFTLLKAPSDVELELRRGFAVEASGWKGERGTAITSSAATQAFYRALALDFHAAGQLRLSTIVLDGAVVAFDLAVLHRRRLYVMKTGFDESFAQLSPGMVLRRAVIERCFEDGVEAHDFAGPDAPWKQRFSTGLRENVSFNSYRRAPAPSAEYAYRRFLRPALKRMYRGVVAVK